MHDVDGGPLDDRPVQLGVGLSGDDLLAASFTLGLACAGGECGERFDTSTDGDGAYRLTVKGSDTQSFFGTAEDVALTVTAGTGDGQVSGASATATFEVQTERVRLPDLDLVDPGLDLDGDAVRWDGSSGLGVVAFETDSPVAVWRATGAGDVQVDRRILEDATGRVVVAGVRAEEIEGSAVQIVHRSPGLPFAGPYGAPPSRGAACAAPEGRSCALTDGDLVTDATIRSPATVTLDDPVPAELVVVRGCTSSCEVQTSGDGETFARVGAVTGEHGVVALEGADVVAVRVLATSLREVSVWGPAPEIEEREADESALRDVFGIAGADESPPVGLVALAAAAAGAALVAAATSLRASRRRAHRPST